MLPDNEIHISDKSLKEKFLEIDFNTKIFKFKEIKKLENKKIDTMYQTESLSFLSDLLTLFKEDIKSHIELDIYNDENYIININHLIDEIESEKMRVDEIVETNKKNKIKGELWKKTYHKSKKKKGF